MAGSGNSQIIGGQTYTQYTPQWYAAMDAEKVRQAKVSGQAAGTEAGQADASKYQTKYPGYGTPPPPNTTNPFGSILAGLNGAGGTGGVGGVGGGGSGFPHVLGAGTSGTSGGFGGGGSAPPPTGTSSSSGYGVPQLQAPDTTAATNAVFNRAKDQVGQTARGALTGLAGAMAGRGTVGSGVEGHGQEQIINQGQQQLGDVTRQNAITQADTAQKNAELSYTGGISMRGQDINHGDTYNSQLLTQRGQDVTASGQQLAAQQARADLALRALQSQYAMQGMVY